MNPFELIYIVLSIVGNEGILWAVIGLLIAFFWMGYRNKEFRPLAPSLMTSLGILGTFSGIFLALYPLDFSPGKINDSIESLLGGMQTAFVTSLLGLAFAIAFRLTAARWRNVRDQMDEGQVQILDLLALIRSAIAGEGDTSMVTQMQKLRDENRSGFGKLDDASEAMRGNLGEALERLDGVKQAIAGEGDSSMVTQMQKLRDENQTGFKKLDGLSETIRESLIKNLEQLIEDIRDVIGKQLGESLQKLVANIEKALIEQFGRTFVEFNEATQAIKKWQEDHRNQVEQLTTAFQLAADGVEQIRKDCAEIPATMEQLRATMGVAQQSVEALNRQVEAFVGMRKQAEESFPVIKQNLDQIGEDLSNSAKGFQEMDQHMQGIFTKAEVETRRIAQQHSENVQKMAASMKEAMEESQRMAAEEVRKSIQSSMQEFQGELEKVVTAIAKSWGENMVAIAEDCAEAIRNVGPRRGGL